MIKIFILGLLCILVRADDNSVCQVDHDEYNNTQIYCDYLKLDNQEIRLSQAIPTSNFVSLHLTHCTGKITEASFPNIREITTINIFDMKLDEFVFPNFPKVDYIRIKNSTVPTISGAFKNLKALTGLTLIENKMQIDDNSFKGFTSLEELEIFGQEVILTTNLLKDLEALKGLIISKAKIEKIPTDVFNKNTELLKLNLGNNPIKTIEEGALDPLKKLTDLHLSPSDLQKFNIDLVKELKQLQSLGIPARSVKDFDLEKFLKYCPQFSAFHFLTKDTSCPEVNELVDKSTKSKAFLAIAYHGDEENIKSC